MSKKSPRGKSAQSAKAASSTRVAGLVSAGIHSLVNMACVVTVGASVFVCLLVATKLS